MKYTEDITPHTSQMTNRTFKSQLSDHLQDQRGTQSNNQSCSISIQSDFAVIIGMPKKPKKQNRCYCTQYSTDVITHCTKQQNYEIWYKCSLDIAGLKIYRTFLSQAPVFPLFKMASAAILKNRRQPFLSQRGV